MINAMDKSSRVLDEDKDIKNLINEINKLTAERDYYKNKCKRLDKMICSKII